MVKRKPHRGKRRNGAWRPITIEQACEAGHFSRRTFYRIKDQLDTRKLGRRLIVNENSVFAYIRSLPRSC